MPRHLLLRLEGPLLAFGGETVDARGVIADFPGRSLLTGLVANALGWRRTEWQRLARLQERLVFAARIDREAQRLTDFQTVELAAIRGGWTTRGLTESRSGGGSGQRHLRYRDLDADKSVTVALRLEPSDEAPGLQAVADAIREPVRPLFLGRKSCLPSCPIFLRIDDGGDLVSALKAVPLADDSVEHAIRVVLPVSEADDPKDDIRAITDERDWRSGVHAGARRVGYRTVPRTAFAGAAS